MRASATARHFATTSSLSSCPVRACSVSVSVAAPAEADGAKSRPDTEEEAVLSVRKPGAKAASHGSARLGCVSRRSQSLARPRRGQKVSVHITRPPTSSYPPGGTQPSQATRRGEAKTHGGWMNCAHLLRGCSPQLRGTAVFEVTRPRAALEPARIDRRKPRQKRDV